jgi:hypothetical protein
MDSLLKKHTNLLTFTSLLLITHLFYFPTWNAGFVTDFSGLVSRLEGAPARGILNCFGFPAMEQVLNTALYLFYQFFEISPLPWYLLHTTLHALNTFLVLRFSAMILQHFELKYSHWIAWAGALFFLLSPYQSEVLTWRVCLNYLMVTGFVLWSLCSLVRWLKAGERKHLWQLHIAYLLALFTFELAIMLPFMTIVLLALFPYKQPKTWRIVLPQLGLLAVYFGLNRIVLGSWIGHYGADTHLRFPIREMSANLLSYTVKLLGFVRYYKHSWKTAVFEVLNQPVLLYSILFCGVVGMIAVLWKFNKRPASLRAATLFLLLFGLSLAPVLNLYFNYLLHIENDRYGYLPSVFFFPALAILFSRLPRRIFVLLSAGYLMISGYYLHRSNHYWKESARVFNGLIESFDPADAPAVLLLNLPENYNGAPMFGDYSDQSMAFRTPLEYVGKKSYDGMLYDVAQYNMTRLTDGVEVSFPDSSQVIKVEFRQWGNWWWYRGIGMGAGYENEAFKVISHGHHYELYPKDLPEGTLLLRQEGAEWQEVK